MSTIYYGYLRISSRHQTDAGRAKRNGTSDPNARDDAGLGLDAQKSAVEALAAKLGGTVTKWFKEIESGRNNERPELAKALSQAKRASATIICSKIDRLARNVRFLLSIIESGVDVLFCDLPTIPPGPTGKFILTQMASVAELEAGLISQRTRAALQALKARGVKLGSARPEHWLGREQVRLDALVKARAARIANLAKKENPYADLMSMIESMERDGKSLKEIAAALNASGHTTSRGSQFKPYSVGRVLGRY